MYIFAVALEDADWHGMSNHIQKQELARKKYYQNMADQLKLSEDKMLD